MRVAAWRDKTAQHRPFFWLAGCKPVKNWNSMEDLRTTKILNQQLISLQWLWSTPYTSKHLLRRYLDHPKTKTPSTEVFGCLGSVTYKCEHQKILRRLPLNRRWCGLHFGGFRVGLTSKNPNVCFVCFVCLVLFWLVGWLVVLFCFFGQSMGTCLSKPPQEKHISGRNTPTRDFWFRIFGSTGVSG